MLKGIYLGAGAAYHVGRDIIYQDISGKRDIAGDMMDVNLSEYDYVICTPPCNYWSKARGSRQPSQYALETRDLLPNMMVKLYNSDLPFLIENVRNKPLFEKYDLFSLPLFVYFVGRHTYWSNIAFDPYVDQIYDFKYGGYRLHNKTQGGDNVHNVVERFIEAAEKCVYVR